MNSKDVSTIIQEITTSVIAIVVVGGYFGLIAYQLVSRQPLVDTPGIEILVGAVAGTYFGKVLAVNGARQAGTAAAQAAAFVANTPAATPGNAASGG